MALPRPRSLWTVAGATGAVTVAAVSSLVTALVTASPQTAHRTGPVPGSQAHNVIMFVGDGLADSEITIARSYQVGASGRLAMDLLPYRSSIVNYAVLPGNPAIPDHVPDSAASGTALATGHRTYDGAISMLLDGSPAPTILELAKRAGQRTGLVTTAELADATPAAFAAHVVARECQGPFSMWSCPRDAKESGGRGSIVEQYLDAGVDVLLGGGRSDFEETVQGGRFAGHSVLEQARSVGYAVTTEPAGLPALRAGRAPALGVFASSHLEPEWVGPAATATGTEPARCADNRDHAGQPTLAELTSAAIELLERAARPGRRGFFLVVEGALIDKRAHAADPCGQIGETVALDAAVRQAVRFQAERRDTLVVVTADHAGSAQLVPARAVTAGLTATLGTPEGAELTISYATATGGSQQHTGVQVPVLASGPGSPNFLGIHTPRELFTAFTRSVQVLAEADRSA